MLGKFDSYRDSALHFLCSGEWSNESFGDVNGYGVYIWRISNNLQEVNTGNIEINSVLEDWEAANPEMLGVLECSLQEFRTSLAGHFMVSENEQGLVTVRQYTLESELVRHFNNMQEHYDAFTGTTED
jgi:hypothetical protein